MVLPHAGAETARFVTDRVCAAVNETEFEGDALEPATRCSIATGLATYPVDGTTAEALAQIAHDRLAQASSAHVSPNATHATEAEVRLSDVM
jgi:GGDEF domain-containing protein